MKDKHILMIFAAAILLILLSFGAVNIIGNTTDENNTTDINLTINETNDTNNTTTQTTTQTSTKKTQSSQNNKQDNVYYDEKLNVYFDENGKTAYDGQVPKGTSKSDLEKMAQAESSGNLE